MRRYVLSWCRQAKQCRHDDRLTTSASNADNMHGTCSLGRGGKGRLVRRLLFIAGLMFACSAAFASQTLTIDLQTPSLDKSDPPVVSSATAPAASSDQATTPTTTTTQSSKSAMVKIGRVGLVSLATATIHQSRSSFSRVYARVKAETPLAITHEEDSVWLGVLMANGVPDGSSATV